MPGWVPPTPHPHQHYGLGSIVSHQVSRAPTVVLGFLMLKHGLSFDEAWATVVNARPFIKPNDGFLLQLNNLWPINLFLSSCNPNLSNIYRPGSCTLVILAFDIDNWSLSLIKTIKAKTCKIGKSCVSCAETVACRNQPGMYWSTNPVNYGHGQWWS